MNQTVPTPTFLPDTNILVHYVRYDALYQWIEANYPLIPTDPQPLLSIVTVGEILSLAKQFGWGQAKRQSIDDFIARCIVVQLNAPNLIDAYVDLDFESLRIGRKMGENDLWIAATARITGATLLTTDKDFDHLAPSFLRRDWIDPAKGKTP